MAIKIEATAGKQYKALSVIPGFDIIWYAKTICFSVVFIVWITSISFTKE